MGERNTTFAIFNITLYPDPQGILAKTYYLVYVSDSYNYSTPFVISEEDYKVYKLFIDRWVGFKLVGVMGPELITPPDRLITNILASKSTDPYHRQYYRVFIYLSSSHDVEASSITSSKAVVGKGYSLNINVTVTNRGAYIETFNVTAYYDNGTSMSGFPAGANTTEIGTEEVTALPGGDSAQIVFKWATMGFSYGNYTVGAYAWPVSNETDTSDNTLKAPAQIEVTIPGDVDGNHVVNILDVVKITSIYASMQGDPKFNPNCDIDDDGKITILDVVACTSHYGQKWP
jgi:hypothetical protein